MLQPDIGLDRIWSRRSVPMSGPISGPPGYFFFGI